MADQQPPAPAPTAPDARTRGDFVERMFSGFGHASDLQPGQPRPVARGPYRPLHQAKAPPGATVRLQRRAAEARVQPDSPATEVMTDLQQIEAVTIGPAATVHDAHQTMISRRVRSLLVVDEGQVLLGVITSSDVLGERPIQIAQHRGAHHIDVLVREVMTPAHLVETIDLDDVVQARVGDVVETLKHAGRQHAIVIARGGGEPAVRVVRGIFSLTQIARQLGLPPQVAHDVARTFAEIEAAVGA